MSDWSDVERVLFDWNGTLLADSVRAWGAIEDVLADLGLPSIDYETFIDGFRLPLRDWLGDLGVEPDSLDGARTAWNRNMEAQPADLQPGARSLLLALDAADRTVGVVSAAATRSVEADIDRLELGDLIDFVVGDAEDKVAALRSAVDGQKAVYVGDAEYDVEAGNRAGVLTIAFAGGYRPRVALEATGADAVVDHLYEVGQLIGL